MSLPPGTRIPTPCPECGEPLEEDGWCLNLHCPVLQARRYKMKHHPFGAYYRGLVEGLTLGSIAGSLVTACALALAWAHMGG